LALGHFFLWMGFTNLFWPCANFQFFLLTKRIRI